jgi:uncharacterized protein (TIGR00299 family) protein
LNRLLYVDCVAGIAGDMLLGALLDAGADVESVRAGLSTLPLENLELEVGSTERHGIRAARVQVKGTAERAHRTWPEVQQVIDSGALPERATRRAQDAFRRLAGAEGRIHGRPPEEVRFHEVGALDAVADICGVALALEQLQVDQVICSPLPLARGMIDADHGRLPLPAPATLELLRGAPIYGVELDVELVTPTGAALVAAVASGYGPLPPMQLEAVGYGAGSRDLEALPNVVRVVIGEAVAGRAATSSVSLIETNLDDLSPELVPDAAEGCFAAGALDVWATPAQMKKGRPGIVFSALARPADERAVAEAIMRQTSTLGLRIAQLGRWELDRELQSVEVAGEPVRVKVGRLDGAIVNIAPEHDDCAAVAGRTGRPVKSVWAAALAAMHERIDSGSLDDAG